MVMNWKMAMEQHKYTVKGSEINFPDKNWDWNVLFFDEIPVGSWAVAKLRYRAKKASDEDQEAADDDEAIEV